MLCFMGAGHHLAGTDAALLIGGYRAIKDRGVGCVSMPYIKLDRPPANIETIFCQDNDRTACQFGNRKGRMTACQDQSVDLYSTLATAWRYDDELCNIL